MKKKVLLVLLAMLVGMTMIMATHQMEFARAVANEIVFMEKGVIIEHGTPAELLAEGAKTRTRDFCTTLLSMESGADV